MCSIPSSYHYDWIRAAVSILYYSILNKLTCAQAVDNAVAVVDVDGGTATGTAGATVAAVVVTADVAAKGVEDGFLVLLSPNNSMTPSSSSLSELQLPPLGFIWTGLFDNKTFPLTGGRFALFSRYAWVLADM